MLQQVDADALVRLLDLQAEDIAIRRLEERRASLPEARRLEEINEQLAELEADITIAKRQLEEVGREQARLEGEIGLQEQKIEREEKRLFSGNVSNPKELGALQAEVDMLKRKRSASEDTLLEVMVQKDQTSATLASLSGERENAAREAAELTAKVDALTTEISSELQAHDAKRGEIAATLPDDLLALYDKLRASKGGVGIAALEGDTCQGCHTKLASKEVERIRSEGGLQRCDFCRRILVSV